MASVDLGTSPWLIRVFDRVPFPLFALGLSAALLFFVFFEVLGITLYPTMNGDYWTWGEGFSLGLVSDIVFSIVAGYLVAAPYYIHQEALRDFSNLRSALNCDDNEYDNWLIRVRNTGRVSLYVGAALSAALGFLMFLDQGTWTVGQQIKTLVQLFVLIRTLAITILSAYLFAVIAHRFADIELLNLERVMPFSKHALRGVLVVMLYIAILSLQVILIPSVILDSGYRIEALIILAVPSFTAAAIFLIPLYPLHRRIQAEKRSELARIRADIHRENQARIAGDEGWASLADLIVYEQKIEKVSTWAFNTPTMFRLSLYVSLGIGSWLGAAFVERWLGTLLGS
jgi:hypothetical protein